MIKRALGLTLLIISLSACSLFQARKIPVQQGNQLTQAHINKLKPGMTPTQVKTLLGNPVLLNTFSGNRMDYVYTIDSDKKQKADRLSLLFVKGKLARIEGSVYPGQTN